MACLSMARREDGNERMVSYRSATSEKRGEQHAGQMSTSVNQKLLVIVL